jgi:anti-sigma B factor antagonist
MVGDTMPADEPTFGLCHRTVGTALVIELRGEIDICATYGLGPTIDALLAPDFGQTVVDLTAVTFLDPGGLRLLTRIRNRAARGGGLWLVPGHPRGMRVLRLPSLQSAFDLLDVLQPALTEGAGSDPHRAPKGRMAHSGPTGTRDGDG